MKNAEKLQDAELPQFTIKGFETNERKIKLATGTYQVTRQNPHKRQRQRQTYQIPHKIKIKIKTTGTYQAPHQNHLMTRIH